MKHPLDSSTTLKVLTASTSSGQDTLQVYTEVLKCHGVSASKSGVYTGWSSSYCTGGGKQEPLRNVQNGLSPLQSISFEINAKSFGGYL